VHVDIKHVNTRTLVLHDIQDCIYHFPTNVVGEQYNNYAAPTPVTTRAAVSLVKHTGISSATKDVN